MLTFSPKPHKTFGFNLKKRHAALFVTDLALPNRAPHALPDAFSGSNAAPFAK